MKPISIAVFHVFASIVLNASDGNWPKEIKAKSEVSPLPKTINALDQEFPNPPQGANSLFFGGTNIVVDIMDCSTDNSSDGKTRTIAAINSSSASSCIIQFGTREPGSGIYITIPEEPIGPGQAVLGGAGTAFDSGFVAIGGQFVTITSGNGKYYAAFKDLILMDPATKGTIPKKISGSFGCN